MQFTNDRADYIDHDHVHADPGRYPPGGLPGIAGSTAYVCVFSRFFVVIPWFSALVGTAAYAVGAPVSTSWIIELVAIPPLAVALFSAIPLMQVRGARSLHGAHTYEFSDGGIHLTGPGFDNQVDWSILTRCYSFKPGLLFVSGNAPLITVPSHSLSAANKAELGRLLAAKGVQARGTW